MVNFGQGNADRWDTIKRQRLWNVRWQSARLQIMPGGNFAGQMVSVTGSLLDKGTVVSTFQAQSADADKDRNILFLRGSVKIYSIQERATLTCQAVEYDGHQKVAKARGQVVLRGPAGRISGMEELWATADLRTAGTPDLFRQR